MWWELSMVALVSFAASVSATPIAQQSGCFAFGSDESQSPEDSVQQVNGGHATAIREMPWLVHLDLVLDGVGPNGTATLASKCTGTLITPQHVLTAAHCVLAKLHDNATYSIGFGATRRSEQQRVEQKLVANVSVFTKYSFMDANLLKGDDLAIIKLDTKLTLSELVRPVCLYCGEAKLDSGGAIVAGWGHGYGQKTPDGVLSGTAELASCEEGRLFIRGLPTHKLGDSGGPLLARINGSGPYLQVAVTSFGVFGEDDFNRVNGKWIHQITGQDLCSH